MATWKKVFTSGDIIPVANGGTGANLSSDGVVVAGGATLVSVALGNAQILVGQTGSEPTAQELSGDVEISNTAVATIQDDAVSGNKIANHGVALSKLAEGTKGDLITFNAAGDAIALPVPTGAGSDGQVLTVDASEASGLAFASAPSATNSSISSLQLSRDPIVTASGTVGDATLHGTVARLSFDPDESFAHKDIAELDAAVYTAFNSDTSRAGLFSSSGFQGRLAGEASGAINVKTAAASGTVKIGCFADASVGYQSPLTQNILTLTTTAGQEKLTIAGSLEVTGTTTTVDSTTLTVADAVIKVGEGATSSTNAQNAASASDAGGLGISVANGSATDDSLARFVYTGYNDTASVLGWKIAQETADNAADLDDAVAYGVGVMHVQSGVFSAGSNAFDIGKGAMLFTSNGGGQLFIQTA